MKDDQRLIEELLCDFSSGNPLVRCGACLHCRAADAIQRLSQPALCGVCWGRPLVSGKACVCGGAGTEAEEIVGLRKMIFEQQNEIESLQRLSEDKPTSSTSESVLPLEIEGKIRVHRASCCDFGQRTRVNLDAPETAVAAKIVDEAEAELRSTIAKHLSDLTREREALHEILSDLTRERDEINEALHYVGIDYVDDTDEWSVYCEPEPREFTNLKDALMLYGQLAANDLRDTQN